MLCTPFLCPLLVTLGSAIFCLYWLSEAELGLASVALTRMFSVPAPHSGSLQQACKGSQLLLPPLFMRFHCFTKQAYLLSWFESGVDVFLGLL